MSGIPGGAFHSTKISGNSSSKSNETESFRKFVLKISVHLSRLSFFLDICGGLMVSALDSEACGPGLKHGRGHCVVFLGKTLYFHGASLHPGV